LSDYAKLVNLQAADKLKLSLSSEVLKGYKALVEKDGTSRFGK
jgi:putative tryptophan/tyrosine transport system substrate-binding protein